MSFLVFLFTATLNASADAPRVFVVGDSLSCGYFGKYLMRNLEKSGNRVSLFCAVSSRPNHWLKGKKPEGKEACFTMTSEEPQLKPCLKKGQMMPLSMILALSDRAPLVIALGTNSLYSVLVDDSYQELAAFVAGYSRSCFWIGPPNLNPDQSLNYETGRLKREQGNLSGFYTSLGKAIENHCELIDSRDATALHTPGIETLDGVHRSETAGFYWAARLGTEWL